MKALLPPISGVMQRSVLAAAWCESVSADTLVVHKVDNELLKTAKTCVWVMGECSGEARGEISYAEIVLKSLHFTETFKAEWYGKFLP